MFRSTQILDHQLPKPEHMSKISRKSSSHLRKQRYPNSNNNNSNNHFRNPNQTKPNFTWDELHSTQYAEVETNILMK